MVVGALAALLMAPAAALSQEKEEATLAEVLKRLEALERENVKLRGEVDRLGKRKPTIQSDELRALVKELAEKETVTTGLTAGYDKHFFLSDADRKFLVQIEGQVQGRYVYNYRDGASKGAGFDEEEAGFLMRRAKVGFKGHVFDPSLEYKIKGGFERSGGGFILEDAYLKYKCDDQHYVQFGQHKAPFLHEELVSSGKQLTVERSAVNEMFTVDFAQGVTVGGKYDLGSGLGWSVSLHDGREQDNTDFDEDATEFAVAGRVEVLVAGSWKQFKDFVAWEKDAVGLLVGAAADYGQMDSGSGTTSSLRDYLAYTADVSLEAHPFNAFAAFVGRHGELDGAGGSIDQTGVVAQGGVFILPETVDVFARGEYIDYDGVGEFGHKVDPLSVITLKDEVMIYTWGFNYYVEKHDVKFTLDLMWAPDGIRAGESGAGTLTSVEDDEFVARFQVQLLF